MIKIILIIIILILVVSMNYNNDYFQSSFDISKCNFLPWGPSLNACKTYCLHSDTKLKTLYI